MDASGTPAENVAESRLIRWKRERKEPYRFGEEVRVAAQEAERFAVAGDAELLFEATLPSTRGVDSQFLSGQCDELRDAQTEFPEFRSMVEFDHEVILRGPFIREWRVKRSGNQAVIEAVGRDSVVVDDESRIERVEHDNNAFWRLRSFAELIVPQLENAGVPMPGAALHGGDTSEGRLLWWARAVVKGCPVSSQETNCDNAFLTIRQALRQLTVKSPSGEKSNSKEPAVGMRPMAAVPVVLNPKTYSAPDDDVAVRESMKHFRPDLSQSSPEYQTVLQRLVAGRRESGAWTWDFMNGLRQPWNPVEELVRLAMCGLTDRATVERRLELESVDLVTLDLVAFYRDGERARIDGFSAVLGKVAAWNNQPIEAKVDSAAHTAREIRDGLVLVERKSGLWIEEVHAVQNAVQEFRAEAKLGRVTVAGREAGSAFELVLMWLRDVVTTWKALAPNDREATLHDYSVALNTFFGIVSKGPTPRDLWSQLDSDFALAKVALKQRAAAGESRSGENQTQAAMTPQPATEAAADDGGKQSTPNANEWPPDGGALYNAAQVAMQKAQNDPYSSEWRLPDNLLSDPQLRIKLYTRFENDLTAWLNGKHNPLVWDKDDWEQWADDATMLTTLAEINGLESWQLSQLHYSAMFPGRGLSDDLIVEARAVIGALKAKARAELAQQQTPTHSPADPTADTSAVFASKTPDGESSTPTTKSESDEQGGASNRDGRPERRLVERVPTFERLQSLSLLKFTDIAQELLFGPDGGNLLLLPRTDGFEGHPYLDGSDFTKLLVEVRRYCPDFSSQQWLANPDPSVLLIEMELALERRKKAEASGQGG